MKKEICYAEFQKMSCFLDKQIEKINRFDYIADEGFCQNVGFTLFLMICENEIDLSNHKIVSFLDYTTERFQKIDHEKGSIVLVDLLRQLGYSIAEPLRKEESCIIY